MALSVTGVRFPSVSMYPALALSVTGTRFPLGYALRSSNLGATVVERGLAGQDLGGVVVDRGLVRIKKGRPKLSLRQKSEDLPLLQPDNDETGCNF